ncbi:MAG TPA: hypothetical protein PLK34_01255 [Candidatus Pacearchaeota archaeon]|nr:hypothetical protein [Candidatus Pacearchaeota archaeon]
MNEEKELDIFCKVAKSIDDVLGFSSGTVGAKLLISAANSTKRPEGFCGLFTLKELNNKEPEVIRKLLSYPLELCNEEAYIDNSKTEIYTNGIISLTYRARKRE